MSNKYLDIAIEKVVKQEVNEVLDKIKDEIAEEYQAVNEGDYKDGLKVALDVIDKYRKEQE